MSWWRLWCKALGTKEGDTQGEADIVAIMRTFYIILTVTCAVVIIASNVHHW